MTRCGVGACARNGATSCAGGRVTDSCQAGAPAANDRSCNSVDDDCDSRIDEDYASEATTCGVGICVANGATACVAGAVINNCRPTDPEPNDATCDGRDNDCDGTSDEGVAQSNTTCGLGVCRATGVNRCVNGLIADSCTPEPNAVEEGGELLIRCDGLDNDCDGHVDEGYPSAIGCRAGELYCNRANGRIEVCGDGIPP